MLIKRFRNYLSTQRFALSHDEAIDFAKIWMMFFVDTKELVIYPISTKEEVKTFVKRFIQKIIMPYFQMLQ